MKTNELIHSSFVSMASLTPLRGDAQTRDWNHGHMWDWGFGILWGLFGMIVWLGLLLLLIVFLVRWIGGSSSSRNRQKDEDPLQILKKRYAHGEISKEEYQEMRKTLNE